MGVVPAGFPASGRASVRASRAEPVRPRARPGPRGRARSRRACSRPAAAPRPPRAPCTVATSRSGGRPGGAGSPTPRARGPARRGRRPVVGPPSRPARCTAARRRARSAWNSANCSAGHLGQHVQHAEVDRARRRAGRRRRARGSRGGRRPARAGRERRRPARATARTVPSSSSQQDRVLAGEVVVHRRLAHPGRVGDRAGAGRREADRAEEGRGRVEHVATGVALTVGVAARARSTGSACHGEPTLPPPPDPSPARNVRAFGRRALDRADVSRPAADVRTRAGGSPGGRKHPHPGPHRAGR